MSELTFRLADENDCMDLSTVFVDSFGITNERIGFDKLVKNIAKELKHRIKSAISYFYLAYQNEQAVGLGAETRFEGSSYIGYVGVLRNVWRQGIGTKLFQFILEKAEKHNPTVELFSNPGADRVYRKLDFKDQFLTYKAELTSSKDIIIENVQEEKKIPQWAFDLDTAVMGFDRSKYLEYLATQPETTILSIEEKGYCLTNKRKIGPLIAKNPEVAFNLINYSLATGKKTMLIPDNQFSLLSIFSPVEKQRCVKMIKGIPLENNVNLIWGYNSFASG